MAIPGFLCAIAFTSFLYLPKILEPGKAWTLMVQENMPRPEFWLNPFLEWTVFWTVLIWILAISIYLIRKRPT